MSWNERGRKRWGGEEECGGVDLAEPCEVDEWVVMRSPFGAPPHQNKPGEQCLLGKRFATTEAVTSAICHLKITCHTQADTNLCLVFFCLVSSDTRAYRCKTSFLPYLCLSVALTHTHTPYTLFSQGAAAQDHPDQLDSSEYPFHLTFPQSPHSSSHRPQYSS